MRSLSQPSGAGGRGTRDNYPKEGEQHEYLTASEYRGEGVVTTTRIEMMPSVLACLLIGMSMSMMLSTVIYPNPPGPGARDEDTSKPDEVQAERVRTSRHKEYRSNTIAVE